MPLENGQTNLFSKYFIELNEKAQDELSRRTPEPERALEFLKQAKDLLERIEKLQKEYKESEKKRL